MEYIGDPNSEDPAIRYDALARAAFKNCSDRGDPWKWYASHDFYSNFITEPTTEIGKRGLSTVLLKFIYDYPKIEETKKLIELEESVWASKTQSDIINIIDNAIVICNGLGT